MTDTDAATLHPLINQNVEVGSTLHTDEHGGCQGLDGMLYRHERINHLAGSTCATVSAPTISSSVWAVLKRGLLGVYHHASPEHLGRYVDELLSGSTTGT